MRARFRGRCQDTAGNVPSSTRHLSVSRTMRHNPAHLALVFRLTLLVRSVSPRRFPLDCDFWGLDNRSSKRWTGGSHRVFRPPLKGRLATPLQSTGREVSLSTHEDKCVDDGMLSLSILVHGVSLTSITAQCYIRVTLMLLGHRNFSHLSSSRAITRPGHCP